MPTSRVELWLPQITDNQARASWGGGGGRARVRWGEEGGAISIPSLSFNFIVQRLKLQVFPEIMNSHIIEQIIAQAILSSVLGDLRGVAFLQLLQYHTLIILYTHIYTHTYTHVHTYTNIHILIVNQAKQYTTVVSSY